jgi:hypothetical protein
VNLATPCIKPQKTTTTTATEFAQPCLPLPCHALPCHALPSPSYPSRNAQKLSLEPTPFRSPLPGGPSPSMYKQLASDMQAKAKGKIELKSNLPLYLQRLDPKRSYSFLPAPTPPKKRLRTGQLWNFWPLAELPMSVGCWLLVSFFQWW